MRLEKHASSLVDYTQPLSFVFNNKAYKGFKGDTLASALIANDVLYHARSFKYGRKRGIIGAGVEEPNALVSLEIGGRYTPNMKATEIMLYDGLSAVSSSNPHSIDFRAMIKPLHRFMPAGFYYKTFIKQKVWSIVEDRLRSLSGFSKAPSVTDEDVYDHIFELNLAFHQEGTFVPVTYVLTFDGRKVLFLVHILLVGQHFVQVNNYEVVINFFHISHNLTRYSAIVNKFTRI